MITRFLTSEDGATMAEYALMATLIAMAALWRRCCASVDEVCELFNQPELLSALGS